MSRNSHPVKRRGAWWIAAALASLLALVALTKGPPPPTANPPGSFSFAALGDAPYHPWENLQYRLVLESVDAHDLAFVLHVGDILWRPCSDERYGKTLSEFRSLRHPVIYTPGDNEWADCWEPRIGGDEPLERLGRLRRTFFGDPTRSLGGRPLAVASQGSRDAHAEFVENARWAHEGFLFATVHVVGSRNGTEPYPGRTDAAGEEVGRRMEAAVAWLRETFAEATATGAAGVVVGFHADPAFERPADHPDRRPFEPFLTVLGEEVERFGRPVLVVHGDDHQFRVDHPLRPGGTTHPLPNLTRLEVPGSPRVGWVRVVVTPGTSAPFAFEEHVVPRWKYW